MCVLDPNILPDDLQPVASLPALRALILPYAGLLPKHLEPLWTAFGVRLGASVQLHNVHHNASLTAEMAVALMLAAAKMIVPADQRLRAGDWRPRGYPYPGQAGCQRGPEGGGLPPVRDSTRGGRQTGRQADRQLTPLADRQHACGHDHLHPTPPHPVPGPYRGIDAHARPRRADGPRARSRGCGAAGAQPCRSTTPDMAWPVRHRR